MPSDLNTHHNGWFSRAITSIGGLSIPSVFKTKLGLTSGAVVMIREYDSVLVLIPEVIIPSDTPMSAAGVDSWVRQRIGAVSPPAEDAPPSLFPPQPKQLNYTEMTFKMMLEGKKPAPPQPPVHEQRSWQVVVDGKGHLDIPEDLRRLLGRYQPRDTLIVNVRYDMINNDLHPVVCFRAVTSAAEKDDLLSDVDLRNRHKEEISARERHIKNWIAELERRQAVLVEQEKRYAAYDKYISQQGGGKIVPFAQYTAMTDSLYRNIPASPYVPIASLVPEPHVPPPVVNTPLEHEPTPTTEEKLSGITIRTYHDTVPADVPPPPTARPGYKMSHTPFGWIEVADVDYVMPEDKP